MKRIVLVVVLIAAVAFAAWDWLSPYVMPYLGPLIGTSQQSASAPRGGPGMRRAPGRDAAVPVLAVAAERRDVPVFRDGIGNVQAYAAITVRAQVEGRLLSVEVREGQDVRKGDLLARIDPSIYQAQYDQAVAKKAQDEATLANARLDLERYQRLAATNAGSRQQADSQKALVMQLEAQVRGDQAAIDNAKAYLDYTTIIAPIDGRAGLRQVDAGNIVRASDANGLVTLAQVKPISVVFTLPQRDFPIVSEAMRRGPTPVSVLDADGRGTIARGQLEVIDNQMDSTTGTFKLKAVFANDDTRLWPGQFVSTRVQVQQLAGVTVVPTPALRRGPDGPFVYLVTEGPKASVRRVKPLLQDEDIAVIAEGLSPGERVVTSGFGQLADGKDIAISGETPAAAPTASPNGTRPMRPDAAGGARGEGRRPDGQRPEGQRGPGAGGPGAGGPGGPGSMRMGP